MQNITIFCSASDTVAPIYKNEAETVGQWIGTHHKTLVYGGANGGLMEIVAKEVRDNGSQVLGIITATSPKWVDPVNNPPASSQPKAWVNANGCSSSEATYSWPFRRNRDYRRTFRCPHDKNARHTRQTRYHL